MHDICEHQYLSTKSRLKKAHKPEDFQPIIADYHEMTNLLFDLTREQSGRSIDCCSGCNYCCYLKVDAKAPEIFAIVAYMRRMFTREQIEIALDKARVNATTIAPLSAQEHLAANIACPLLVEGKCSVYDVRPFACRSFHAQQVQTCKYSYDNPQDLESMGSEIPEVKLALTYFSSANTAAFQHEGYDSRPYDLNSGLLQAFSNPKSEKRWRKKTTAFPQSAVAKTYEG